MKEKIKTILIIILALISVNTLNSIWLKQGEALVLNEEDLGLPLSYSLIDIIRPSKTLINFSYDSHTIVYDEMRYSLWDTAKEPLNIAFSLKDLKIEDIPLEEIPKLNNENSIEYSFLKALEANIIFRALEVESPNKAVDIGPIKKIHINFSKDGTFFVIYNDTEAIKISHSKAKNEDLFKTAKLKEHIKEVERNIYDSENTANGGNLYYSMRENIGIEKDIYIPYGLEELIPEVYLENGFDSLTDDDKDRIVELVFQKKRDYIREIEEANGSNIYSIGDEILKINAKGYIEYYNNIDESINNRKLYESLQASIKFLSSLVKDIEEVNLIEIMPINNGGNLGYKFIYNLKIRGIGVIFGPESNPYIETDVYGNKVTFYKQILKDEAKLNITLDSLKKESLDAFSVIDKNYRYFTHEYIELKEANGEFANIENIEPAEILSVIEDVTISYYHTKPIEESKELIPIWEVKTQGYYYGFDIYQGELIYRNEKEIK